MSSSPHLLPPRGVITDSLLEYVTTQLFEQSLAIAVGDGEKPPEAGWPQASPGIGEFAAFCVISTDVGQIKRDESRLSGQHFGWILSYKVSQFGATRSQADWCADKVRNVVASFRELPELDDWSIETVLYPGLGPVTRNDQVQPPEWSIVDTPQVYLTRSRQAS